VAVIVIINLEAVVAVEIEHLIVVVAVVVVINDVVAVVNLIIIQHHLLEVVKITTNTELTKLKHKYNLSN
jgi:hypothetical protein